MHHSVSYLYLFLLFTVLFHSSAGSLLEESNPIELNSGELVRTNTITHEIVYFIQVPTYDILIIEGISLQQTSSQEALMILNPGEGQNVWDRYTIKSTTQNGTLVYTNTNLYTQNVYIKIAPSTGSETAVQFTLRVVKGSKPRVKDNGLIYGFSFGTIGTIVVTVVVTVVLIFFIRKRNSANVVDQERDELMQNP